MVGGGGGGEMIRERKNTLKGQGDWNGVLENSALNTKLPVDETLVHLLNQTLQISSCRSTLLVRLW